MTKCKMCGRNMTILSHHVDIFLFSDGKHPSYFYYCNHCGTILCSKDDMKEWMVPTLTETIMKKNRTGI